ncbi:MAG TPA: hypothetical protein VNZ49_04455 [Bacteroidia bacterium]|jgi:hypothetical protein|nr:hypothetical protein [Bacteroidia bacterium]
MKKAKDILFTFDYELFLGNRSGTAANCILLPTQKILELFNKHSISGAIFFIDTTYLLRLKDNSAKACREDLKKISEQIALICRDGHYVFPHLHAHWLDAIYLPEINQWDLSNISKYSFSAINTEERERLFSESIKLLKEICGPQKDMGYRAGGWCIQPFSDFKPHFEKYNIKYDFSVMKGFYSDHASQKFDFREAPAKSFYHFSDDVIEENTSGIYTEIPISTLKISYPSRILNRVLTRLMYMKGVSNYGDGYSTFSASVAEIKPPGNEMASIENLTLVNLSDYKGALRNNNYLQFISHPKMVTPLNLECFDQLLKDITKKYKVNTDFKKLVSVPSLIEESSVTHKKEVLLISYVFPPYPGIGGRRWAKFAKHLTKKNIKVNVITAQNPFSETSVWNRDVKTETIRKNIIPHRYPAVLIDPPFNYLKRLQYKLSLNTVQSKTQGSIYDRAVFSEKDILETASQLIEKNNITHIICTGAPFSILHYGVELKKKYPKLKLLSDMRDPWTWGIAYGFGTISEKRLAYEKKLEQEVLEFSDLISVPVAPMEKHLKTTYTEQAEKVFILPHGIDIDDLPVPDINMSVEKSNKVQLIYCGTIYRGAEKILKRFSGLLINEKENPIKFTIYPLSNKEALKHKFSAGPIQIKEPLSPNELFEIIQTQDFYVSIVTEQYKDFISTKYYEIIYLKKPIILISPKGILSEFIVSNNLGLHFTPDKLSDLIVYLQSGKTIDFNKNFDLSNFFYNRLTDSIITNFIEK